MKVFFVFIVVVVYGVVCETPQPFPCQFPPKFTATLTDLKTINSQVIKQNHMAYDLERKIESMTITKLDRATGRTTTLGRAVVDYQEKRQYYFPAGDPTNACYAFPLELTSPDKLPPGAGDFIQLKLGSGYVGPPDVLPYNMIYFTWQSGVNVTWLIDPISCALIVRGMGGYIGPERIDDVHLSSNFVPSVKDTSVFDIPATCAS